MKPLDHLLADIARDHLDIRTLQPRRSDALDFHNLAVWQIKTALTAAFNAGAQAAPQLLEALVDLLGDLPSVQSGWCRHCGREYDDIDQGDCPSDDCPSYKARVTIATVREV